MTISRCSYVLFHAVCKVLGYDISVEGGANACVRVVSGGVE